MMKRCLAFLLILLMVPLCVFAEEAAAKEDHTVERKTYPHVFAWRAEDEPAEEEMDLFFVAGGDYRLFCLVSGQSFSCGNLLPAICKQSGIMTLIGQRTGGGSNSVLPATTASGAFFRISGTKQLSTSMNGSFYNIDTGIEPDVILTSADSYYDRQGLVDMIHGLK